MKLVWKHSCILKCWLVLRVDKVVKWLGIKFIDYILENALLGQENKTICFTDNISIYYELSLLFYCT